MLTKSERKNLDDKLDGRSFDYYYQEELTYMRDMGRVFSDAYPKLAPYLGKEGDDPDVERLLEGFAFIAGRIRQQLDGSLSEFAQDINQLMWPQLQRPIPSISIAEFTPPDDNISTRQKISRGSELISKSVQGTQCVFSTCYDVELFPLHIQNIESSVQDGISQINISFESFALLSLDQMHLNKIRLFINTDTVNCSKLYQILFSQLENVQVKLQSEGRVVSTTLPASVVQNVGLSSESSILPTSDTLLDANQLLLEYFCFPEKHLFVDIYLSKGICRQFQFDSLTISLIQKQNFENINRLSKSTFLLYCAPMVNLFEMDADPLSLDRKKLEYLITPASQLREHYNIYSIDSVVAIKNGGRTSIPLTQLHSTGYNGLSQLEKSDPNNYYQLKIRSSVLDGVDNFLLFRTDLSNYNDQTIISTQLTCTNHDLPSKLELNDIVISGNGVPPMVKVTNITIPTKSVCPDLGGSSQWQMLSNISSSFMNNVTKKNIKILLSSFNISAKRDRHASRNLNKKIDSIVEIECQTTTRLLHGIPIHGYELTFEVHSDFYSNEGDMFIFFDILFRFFQLIVDINCFCILNLIDIDRGEKYSWGENMEFGDESR